MDKTAWADDIIGAGKKEILRQLSIQLGGEPTRAICNAFNAVSRHEFLDRFWVRQTNKWFVRCEQWEEEALREIYKNQPLAILVSADGLILSAQSTPTFVLALVHAIDVRPGDRILEIGFGSGWLSEILAFMVGKSGLVVGTELEPVFSLTCGKTTWSKNFSRILGDLDSIRDGPFDAILSTSSGNVPKNLFDLLCDSGRASFALEIPGGGDRTVIFRRYGDYLKPTHGQYSKSVPSFGMLASKPRIHAMKIVESDLYSRSLPNAFIGMEGSVMKFIRLREYLASIDQEFCLFQLEFRSNGQHVTRMSFGLLSSAAKSFAFIGSHKVYGQHAGGIFSRLVSHIKFFEEGEREGACWTPIIERNEDDAHIKWQFGAPLAPIFT